MYWLMGLRADSASFLLFLVIMNFAAHFAANLTVVKQSSRTKTSNPEDHTLAVQYHVLADGPARGRREVSAVTET